MTTNTNSAHERTASIDLAQLDKLIALLRKPEGVVSRGVMHDAMAQAADFIEATLARRSLTSGAPADALTPAVIALDAAIHAVLIAGDDSGDELHDVGLRNTLKEAQQVAYRALISIGIDRLPGAVNPLSAFLPKAGTTPVYDAAAPSNDTTDEAARLRKVLTDVRHALQFANDNPGGGISDTLWMMHGPETVFDFIDTALSAGAAAPSAELTEREQAALARFDKPEWRAASRIQLRAWLSMEHGHSIRLGAQIENLQDELSAGAAAKTEQAPRRITEETAQQYMEESLWAFIECAGNFPHVKVDDRIWPHVMVYAASSTTAAGAGSAQPRAEGDERATLDQRLTVIREFGDAKLIEAVATGQIPIHKALEKIDAARAALARAPLPAQGGAQNQAARDVLAERQRQVEAEGWKPGHDDCYRSLELNRAAACYISFGSDTVPSMWPWPQEWWKPTNYRRNMVKAGALVLAEIERLDRAAMRANDGAAEGGSQK